MDSSPRRSSSGALRSSATSIGHGSGSSRRYPRDFGAPVPMPPPRVTSSSSALSIPNSPLTPPTAPTGANPGFVPSVVAELNAAAQAAEAESSAAAALRSSYASGTQPTSSSNPKRDSHRRSGTSAAALRRASARSLRSDISHGTTGHSNRGIHSLNLPPMPEVLPPRGSSMQHLTDDSPISSIPLAPSPNASPLTRRSIPARSPSAEFRAPSLDQMVRNVAQLSTTDAPPKTPPSRPQSQSKAADKDLALSEANNDNSTRKSSTLSEPQIKQRARRATVGSQRGSVGPSSNTNSPGAAANHDTLAASRLSLSSVRSSFWGNGGDVELLPSAASHGHGPRLGSASASVNGQPGAIQRSASPHSAGGATLSPEHNSARLSLGSSVPTSSSRNRESMFTARSSMSATNGHGFELDGISAFSHDFASSSAGGEHRASTGLGLGRDRNSGAGTKRSSGVPSVWIGLARAGEETEGGDEFFDARSDEGDEGEESDEVMAPHRPNERGRPKSSRRDRLSKRASTRSSLISHPTHRTGNSPARASSPAKSVATDHHESDTAAAGHSVQKHGSTTGPAVRKADGLLVPPLPVSSAVIADIGIAESTPSSHSGSRKAGSKIFKKRTKRKEMLENHLADEGDTSSNSSNEAANSYIHGTRPKSKRLASKHGHGSRHGHVLESIQSHQRPEVEAIAPRQSSLLPQAGDEAEADRTQIEGPSGVPDELVLELGLRTLRQREEIARAKTLRRLNIEAAAVRRREAEAQALLDAQQSMVTSELPMNDPIDSNPSEQRDTDITAVSSYDLDKVQHAPETSSARTASIDRPTGPADATTAPSASKSIAYSPPVDNTTSLDETAPNRPESLPRASADSGIANSAAVEHPPHLTSGSPTASHVDATAEPAHSSPPSLAKDDACAEALHTSSLGRKRGFAALFGRSRGRTKSIATPAAATPVMTASESMPLPSPSSFARRPSQPSVLGQRSAPFPSVDSMPLPQGIPDKIAHSASVPPGVGLGIEEHPRSETPADGRATPSGRWRARMPSISSVRSMKLERKQDTDIPPVPPLNAAETGAEEEWRRNLLTDAVGLSLGLATPKSIRSESRTGVRSESRNGYRSGDDAPARSIRRPVTPLPVDDRDPQETIKKSLSTPLLSDDLVDDGPNDPAAIEALMMDLDNGTLVDAERREAQPPKVAFAPALMGRGLSASSDGGAADHNRIGRGIIKSPTFDAGYSPSADHKLDIPSSWSFDAPSGRVLATPTTPRVYSTILEDGPHQSRSETLWLPRADGAATSGLHVSGGLSAEGASALWPSEGGHGSAYTHSDMGRRFYGSQTSLNNGGNSANQSDAEGGPIGLSSFNGPSGTGAYEPIGRISKSVDHHMSPSALGVDARSDWHGFASIQGHSSVGRAGMSPKSSNMLSSLKARLRGRRQQEAKALGIRNVPLTNSQALMNVAPGTPVSRSGGLSSSHEHGLSNSAQGSYQGHPGHPSFLAAQEATRRLLATQEDMAFTPSATHVGLPLESPLPSVGHPHSKSWTNVAEGSMRCEPKNPFLVPPSPSAWSAAGSNEGLSVATSPALSAPSGRRTSTSELAAFDQMLRGYSAANNVLIRQIAARASSSNNHGSAMVAS